MMQIRLTDAQVSHLEERLEVIEDHEKVFELDGCILSFEDSDAVFSVINDWSNAEDEWAENASDDVLIRRLARQASMVLGRIASKALMAGVGR